MESFKALRKRAKVKQAELARAVGASQSAISSWERGRNAPLLRDVKKIPRALGASVEEVVDCFAGEEEE